MGYLEIIPSEPLRTYIKHYFYFESDSQATLDDIVFPSGHMEVIFNLGQGKWQSVVNDEFLTTPPIELWGQITKPMPIRSLGKHNMLGNRFYAHSAACFLQEAIRELNDQIADARDLLGKAVGLLHAQLQETNGLKKRIALVENYLLQRKQTVEKNGARISMIGQIVKDLQHDTLPDNIRSLALKYNLTPRYLQKLFLQYTGVTRGTEITFILFYCYQTILAWDCITSYLIMEYPIRNLPLLKKILWADFVLGGSTAIAGLLLYPVLVGFLGFPARMIITISAITLLYALTAFRLATQNVPSIKLLRILMYANWVWTVISVALLIYYMPYATIFGAIFLILQVIVVGMLAWLEGRYI